jgi:hypothetical protein
MRRLGAGGARTRDGDTMAESEKRPPRAVHYVGFRDDRYWNAYRVFGGPRVIHRRWDFYATRDVGPDDVVIFAQGDEAQPVAERNATDLDERWL